MHIYIYTWKYVVAYIYIDIICNLLKLGTVTSKDSTSAACISWKKMGCVIKLVMVLLRLIGGLEHFLFFHSVGNNIPTDFHIFQKGWNRQPGIFNMVLSESWISPNPRVDHVFKFSFTYGLSPDFQSHPYISRRCNPTMWCPQTIAKLVQITSITMVFDTYSTIVFIGFRNQ